MKKVNLCCCLLIGGQSRRMGQPKHLLKTEGGVSWIENLVSVFTPFVSEVIISGNGELPDSLSGLRRAEDVEGAEGPLAGIAGVMKIRPDADWLIAACDMINISPQAITWLIEKAVNHQDYAGILPMNKRTGKLEPLFGYYRAAAYLEIMKIIEEKTFRVSVLGLSPKFHCPAIPDSLERCWRNVNTPEQLK